VLTWKLLRLLLEVVVEEDDLFESSLEQPTATAPINAATAATPASFRVVFTVPPVQRAKRGYPARRTFTVAVSIVGDGRDRM
jgi:hypothetical protein